LAYSHPSLDHDLNQGMIDAHQHFWRYARGDYHWMSEAVSPLMRDFMPEDLLPLMKRGGITQTILVQAAETEAETQFLLDIATKTPSVAGVVGWLDMTAEDFPQRLSHYQTQEKWLGLRPMLESHDENFILQPQVMKNMELVARMNIPFDILVLPQHLPNLIIALKNFPKLRGVIDHCAKPRIKDKKFQPWQDHLAEIAALPNIYCKISGLVTEAQTDWALDDFRLPIRHIATHFGAKRLIFGSDWPVCTLAASYAEVIAIARIILSELYDAQEIQHIFYQNARDFYRI